MTSPEAVAVWTRARHTGPQMGARANKKAFSIHLFPVINTILSLLSIGQRQKSV